MSRRKPSAEPRTDADRQSAERRQAEALETDPAVERGERLRTGKDIAREGKSEGFVPGATPQPPDAPPADRRGNRNKPRK